MAKEKNVKMIIVILVCVVGVSTFFIIRNRLKNIDRSYEIETITEKDCKYFAVYTEGKYGVIDTTGNLIIKNEYANIIIPNPTKPVFVCYDAQGGSVILNELGEQILTDYEKVEAIEVNGILSNFPYEKSVLKYKQNDLYGLIDFSGNVITKPIYQDIYSVKYKEGELLAKKER